MDDTQAATQPSQRLHPWRLYACLCLSGAAALTYEVVWTRAFSIVIGSTTYALSTVLGAFMMGLAVGAAWGAQAAKRYDAYKLLAVLELTTALLGLATLLVIRNIGPVYAWLYYGLEGYPTLFSCTLFLLVFAMVLVPTSLMGATFPVAVGGLTRTVEQAARDAGRLYSVNTMGAVLGSLASGFLLIPLLGMTWANACAAALNLAAALLVGSGATRMLVGGAAVVAVLLGGWLARQPSELRFNLYVARRVPSHDAFRASLEHFRVVWEREGVEGTVQVLESDDGVIHSLFVEGRPEGGSHSTDRPNQVLMALLPMASLPEAKSFLKIGLGPGVTVSAALQGRLFERIDIVELNPDVVEAVERFFTPELTADPRVHVVVDDARHFLTYTERRYDIISAQASDPTDLGTSGLFTVEYFTAARARLTPEGIFCQYVPYGLLGQEGTETAVKTFASVFPYVSEWEVVEGSRNLLLLGSNTAPPPADEVTRRIARVAPGLESTVVFGAGPERVRTVLSFDHRPVNTDDAPVLEFIGARALLAR